VERIPAVDAAVLSMAARSVSGAAAQQAEAEQVKLETKAKPGSTKFVKWART
jgi:hypothetical protein